MKLLRVLRIIAQVILALTGGTLAGGAALSLLARSCTGPALAPALPLGGSTTTKKAPWEAGRVARVLDGDTYDVLVSGLRLRLLNVDAPEQDQPFGAQATDSVRALLPLGQGVTLQRWRKDLYGRTLARLRLAAPPLPGRSAWVALDSVLVGRGWAYAAPRQLVVRAPQQVAAQHEGRAHRPDFEYRAFWAGNQQQPHAA